MGEKIYDTWKDQITIIHVLDDIGFPTSCENWGKDTGGTVDGVIYPEIEGIPPIIDDGNVGWGDYLIRSWFNPPPNAEDYPMVYIINQDMEVVTIQDANMSTISTKVASSYEFSLAKLSLYISFNSTFCFVPVSVSRQ